MLNRTYAALLLAGLVAADLAVSDAHAQTKGPAGTVTRLVISFPPGGPVDFVARTISEKLGKELGRTIIIDNKPGANGNIAAESVARATPDGATLFFSS